MSLMQFLTVGRSFGGAKEGPNRYRLNEQCLLPKFGKPNPTFRTTTPSIAQEAFVCPPRIGLGETGSLFDIQPGRPPGDGVAQQVSASWRDTTLVVAPVQPAQSPLFGESSKADVSIVSKLAGRVGAEKLSRKTELAKPDLNGIPAANPFASPSAPAVVTEPSKVPPRRKKWQWLFDGVLYTRRKNVSTRRTPVQGEWSLGGVTVVRNDLSDADLEVVPTSSFRGESARRPTAAPVSQGRSLAVVSGRWIGWLSNMGRVRF